MLLGRNNEGRFKEEEPWELSLGVWVKSENCSEERPRKESTFWYIIQYYLDDVVNLIFLVATATILPLTGVAWD